jgi:hypothetical protein
LAIDLSGYERGPGDSNPMYAPLHLDVLAAVRYLHKTGAQSASVVGGSMGDGAAGDASIASRPGEIDRLVSLGGAPNGPADKLKSSTPFIVARDDASEDGPRLPGIREQHEKAREPKKLIVLDGSAHAQLLFQTDQAGRVIPSAVNDRIGRLWEGVADHPPPQSPHPPQPDTQAIIARTHGVYLRQETRSL